MSRRRSVPLAVALLLAACADEAPLTPTPGIPPLQSAVWHVHRSDGQALPALLGHRLLPDGNLEQDFLDSARVEIRADGTWEQRGWYQRFRSEMPTSWHTSFDYGTWRVTETGYELRRATGDLLATLTGPVGAELTLNLRYANQAGVAVSVLRPQRPAPTIHGRWRATALRDQPLPAAYIVDPEFESENGLVSRHIVIDSAVVFLLPNDRYLQRIFYAQWEGPANGAPQTRMADFEESDFGSWTLNGVSISLLSGWLQNKTILGEAAADRAGPLRLNHGITHGDEPAPFRYVRQ